MTTSEEDNVISLSKVGPGEVVASVGGVVDETSVTLALYGPDLDPAAITEKLGVEPSRSHVRGDRKSAGSPPYPSGAWLLTKRGKVPQDPETLVLALLDQVPNPSSEAWVALRAEVEIQLRLSLFVTEWNQGFQLGPETVRKLATIGARLEVGIYVDDGDDT